MVRLPKYDFYSLFLEYGSKITEENLEFFLAIPLQTRFESNLVDECMEQILVGMRYWVRADYRKIILDDCSSSNIRMIAFYLDRYKIINNFLNTTAGYTMINYLKDHSEMFDSDRLIRFVDKITDSIPNFSTILNIADMYKYFKQIHNKVMLEDIPNSIH